MSEPAQNKRSVVEVLTEDHREVEQLFNQARSAVDGATRRDIANKIIAELVRHAVAEKQHLYPAIREHLPDGVRRADQEMSEHARAEEKLKGLETVRGDDPQMQALLDDLETDVAGHVRKEEQELFPELVERVTPTVLVDLGDDVMRAEALAPTRPHPGSPERAPLNKLVTPGAGFIDRVRDLLSGRDV
ncbi:MAG: hemerythrin domain-containing protein [Nocardioidaceae bacterium]